MPPDKYSALWTSHTSISDFLKCPQSYFLKHIYRHPGTNHKIKLMTPSLALGSAVHEVLESLSVLPREKRFSEPIMEKFDSAWAKVSGRRGGFFDKDTEFRYETRGRAMMRRVTENPGPIARLAVKIQKDLPYFWLSEEDNIILCGKIDWLEYLPETDSVHIIDFKTGKGEEDAESLQLPIYHLLVHHCQHRRVEKASYWYLEREDTLTDKALPDIAQAREKILAVARQMKLARQLDRLRCPEESGCQACRPLAAVVRGEAELVGTDEYGYDTYVLAYSAATDEKASVVL
ncbi:MAG: hypothetical protein UY92_C0004G0044 [Candidatus Magasanikbacteria bacterium GW2011_GWA2_56_11]|uniref:PD-(D/E)XK endonuclease-like domain-containing protein n=1 Tax=Candidatus Magasanikbacteria bacterium GW2011_GWA2_56_11 TaxID=1619044 RepID=A0A0G1YH08_9BACT|nr:MAG: hypothetical protein UY92_C0004G0044 [Candidatus Magasanikbacteria bacterium GW2011_GWA2_56_11]